MGVVPPWCVGVGATRPRTYNGGTFGLALHPDRPLARRGPAPFDGAVERDAERARGERLVGLCPRQ